MSERFVADKLERAWQRLARWAAEDRCPAIGAALGSSGEIVGPRSFGRQSPAADAPAVRDDAIFLCASPTKPLTATAVVMLAEAGELQLNDPVYRYVPEFKSKGKRAITIAHVLTHTSGLPDMLPDDRELRERQAPLAEFLSRACALKPDFRPGTAVEYQSMGLLMAGEIVRRVVGMPLSGFLHERIFAPLGMRDTALGMPAAWQHVEPGENVSREDRIAEIRTEGERFSGAAVWNTPYWRRLGVPWGGLLSTPADWARLCRHLLGIHRGDDGILSHAALTTMTTNRLATMPEVPEADRRCFGWGYGWRMNWPAHAESFGDFLSPAAYGHWGATGTLVWIDPPRDCFAVVLTTQPQEPGKQFLAPFSNAVCAALA